LAWFWGWFLTLHPERYGSTGFVFSGFFRTAKKRQKGNSKSAFSPSKEAKMGVKNPKFFVLTSELKGYFRKKCAGKKLKPKKHLFKGLAFFGKQVFRDYRFFKCNIFSNFSSDLK
jgi:hypothetical protein